MRKSKIPIAAKILYGNEYVDINLLSFLKIRYPIEQLDFKKIEKIRFSQMSKKNSIYFMDSICGWWFYDADEKDTNNSIKLESKEFGRDSRKPEAIKVLKKILNAKYVRINNEKKIYKVAEEPKKIFLEVIPRICKFKPCPKILGPITPENSNEFKIFTKIKNIIENTFEIPFSEIPIPKSNIYEMPYSNLIGTKGALKNRYLVIASIDNFFNEESDYFLMGFWGHGVNSYAFYYLRVDSKSRIYFRLPYGGGYMDNSKEKVRINKYLTRFFSLEKKLSKITDHIMAIDSMGESNFELRLKNGDKFYYKSSLYRSEENYQEFSEMINKLLSNNSIKSSTIR